jgi:regulator of replication initiation timing
MNEAMKNNFISWCKTRDVNPQKLKGTGQFIGAEVQSAWIGWQAALSQQPSIDALQYKIDNLMLEYCPDEMTEDQKLNWEKHQIPSRNTDIGIAISGMPQQQAKPSCECTRSHPHEDMSDACVKESIKAERDNLRRQIEGLRAENERLKADLDRLKKPLQSWVPVVSTGQVKVGDKLKFKIGDQEYRETVKRILNPGTDKEEVIYHIGNNFYFITSLIISGFSNHKFVEVLEKK